MLKAVRWTQNYLLYALPFVLVCMVWSSFPGLFSGEGGSAEASTPAKIAWEVLSWNLMIWFLVLIVFLVMLVALPKVRAATLKRLANIRERDEREEQITGQASKAAYLATLSLLILLFFVSVFQLNIYRAANADPVTGKRGTASIGLQFKLLDEPRPQAGPDGEVLFESRDLPLSKSAILLLLIVWQLSIFRFTARKDSLIES